ncbi:MAG: hypothetical protein OEZ06_32425 [Myxococcales bacterium]|nr:hypothetical protein [Myxococcales bacterium]
MDMSERTSTGASVSQRLAHSFSTRHALVALWLSVGLVSLVTSEACTDVADYSLSSAGSQSVVGPTSGGRPKQGALSDEDEQQRRKRMAVTVVNQSAGDCSQVTCGPQEVCITLNSRQSETDPAPLCDTDGDSIFAEDCCWPREEELQELSLAFEFMRECERLYATELAPPTDTSADMCDAVRPFRSPAVCAASRLLDAAGLRSEPITYKAASYQGLYDPSVPPGTPRQVFPQGTAPRVSLALAAFRLAVHVVRQADRTIRDVIEGTQPSGYGGPCSEDSARRTAAELVTAYHLAQEAIDVAVENTLAEADGYLSSSSSPSEATRQAYLGAVLSRAAAAHLLVGGIDGLPTPDQYADDDVYKWSAAVLQFALCTQPALTPQAEMALRAIREAAVSPTDVLDTSLDTNLLVNGGPTSLATGSVRERLRELWGTSELNTAADLPDVLGLRLEDFQEARDYLAQEISTFSRSLTAELPPRVLVNDPCDVAPCPSWCAAACPSTDPTFETKLTRYAATATSAPQRDPMYWVTVAQHEDYGIQNAASQDYGTPGVEDAQTPRFDNSKYYSDLYIETSFAPDDAFPLAVEQFGLAGLIDVATVTASALIPVITNATEVNPNVTDEMKAGLMDPLLLFLQDARGRRLGRLRMVNYEASADNWLWNIQAECYTAEDGMLLVKGEDGLSCAVNGNIEGAGCSLANEIEFNLTATTGLSSDCTTAAATTRRNLDEFTHYYLVQPTAAGLNAPGEYKALASFVTPKAGFGATSTTYERQIPIVPDLAERAQRVLAPSRKFCGRPEVSCVDEPFDARLPLEDELTDDGDSVESSWRYYLDLARQAADEADVLGEDVVDLTLEQLLREERKQIRQIQRAEPAIAELQDICGVDVDPTELLRGISSGGVDSDGPKDFHLLRGDPCSGVADCPMTTGMSCLAGRCTQACVGDDVCSAGRTCVGGVCSWDPVVSVKLGLVAAGGDKSDINRLLACVADSELIRHVTPGNRSLCIWVDNEDKNTICEGATASDPCPVPSTGGSCASVTPPFPNAMTVMPVNDTLGYFNLDEGPPRPLQGLCDDLRRLRADRGNEELLDRVRSTRFFEPDNLELIARRIKWYGMPGSYSSLWYGDRVVGYTGDYNRGAESKLWPCNADARPPSCADGGEGLFCDFVPDCTDVASRTTINYRMRNATIAARDMTIKDPRMVMRGVHSPAAFDFTHEDIRQGNIHERSVDGVPYEWSDYYVDTPMNDTFGVWSGRAYHCPEDPSPCTTAPYLWTSPGSTGPINWPAELQTADLKDLRLGFSNSGWFERGGLSARETPYSYDPETSAYNPAYWFSNLNNIYTGRLLAVTDETQHWDYLSDLLEGRPRDSIRSGPASNSREEASPEKDAPSLDAPELYVVYDYGVFLLPLLNWDLSQAELDDLESSEQYTRTPEVMLDGMELLCEAALGGEPECGEPPKVTGLYDLRAAAKFLECVAQDLRYKTSYGLFVNFPKAALDALREEGPMGAHPRVGGQTHEVIADLRTALGALSGYSTSLADAMSDLAYDLRTLERNLHVMDLEQELNSLEFASTVSRQMAACTTKATEFSGNWVGAITGFFNSVVTCTNALSQIRFAGRIKSLEGEVAQVGSEQTIDNFQEQFENRVGDFDDLSVEILAAQEEVDTQLGLLDSLRRKARRALGKALYMDSDVVEAEMRYDTGSWLRLNTARVRYEEAKYSAQKMAFFARRAIEQRLGVELSTITTRLPLVAAPSGWVDKACQTDGYNFGEDVAGIGHYADSYIGDYVTKLENLVESYRQVYNFHEGTDTAVISLRDDVKNSRTYCAAPVNNLLYQAGQLDAPEVFDSSGAIQANGWRAMDCAIDPVDGEPLPNCVGASRLLYEPAAMPDAEGEYPDLSDPMPLSNELSNAYGYEVRFGPETGACYPADCGFQLSSAWGQTVSLLPGRYRLSWYGRSDGNDPAAAVAVRFEADTTWTALNPSVEAAAAAWSRYYDEIVVAEEQEVTVGVVPRPLSDNNGYPEPQVAYVAAFMLEDVTRSSTNSPPFFANTSFVLERDMPVCEDTDGEVFRRQFWTGPSCMQVCPDGFASACTDVNAETLCYRELTFSMDPRSIEAGNVINVAGFARGNFNYRIESIGLNVVGTGVRNCEESETPSSCYAGGFVPFSLEHLGPHRVRNYQGEDHPVELFPGIIEHARALAAERYLTNPLSSADRGLIEPYYRREYRGRPLSGHFVLRIWEEEGVDFSQIEDIQLVLNYRYWTRNQ